MMKVSGIGKYLGLFLIILYTGVFAAGCAKEQTGAEKTAIYRDFLNSASSSETPQHEQAQNVYQVEYMDVSLNGGGISVCFSPQQVEETLYYSTGENEIYSVVFAQEPLVQKLPIVFGQNEMLECFATENGEDFYCFITDEAGKLGLRHYDAQGNTDTGSDSDNEMKETDGIDKAVVSGQGVIYVKTPDDRICILDTSGHFTGEVSVPLLRDLAVTGEGEAYVTYQAGMTDMVLAKINPKTLSLEQTGKISGDGRLYAGKENKLFYKDTRYLYQWDTDTGECVKYLEWLEQYISPGGIMAFAETEEKNLWILPQISDELWYLKKISREDKKELEGEKEELTIFTMTTGDSALQELIVVYNKQSEKYHVTLDELDYSQVGDAETFANTRLSGAESPDLILLDYYYFSIYQKAGILENLTPYMEISESIKEENYIENVLAGFRGQEDKGIYAIPTGFSIQTMGGRKTQLQEIAQEADHNGGIQGWDWDTFLGYLEENPDVKFEWDGDSMGLLQYCLWYGMDRFVDTEAGTNSFRDAEFSELVDRVNHIHCESNFYSADWENIVRDGDKIVTLLRLYNFFGLTELELQYGDEMLLFGYPTPDGYMKTQMNPNKAIAMLGRSRHKEGAWDFITYYLLNLPRNRVFPSDKEGFLQQLEAARTPLYAQEDVKKEQELPQSYVYVPSEGGMQPVYSLREDQVQKILDAVECAEYIKPETDYIMNRILWEELEYYFNGDKSLEDVLDIVSSRTQLYLDE